MKKISIFLMMMAFFMPFAANAYNHQVQVGVGTSGENFAPINIYYNYSYTQQIYTATQINDGCRLVGDIEAISFYYASSTAKTMPITVYMKTTTKTSFSGTSDWETVSASDIVFDGDLSVSSAGWVTITLDSPFAYDGQSNLLIAVNKPGYYSNYANVNWNATTTGDSQVIYVRSDSNAYDPTSPGTAYGVSTSLPNLLINMTLAHPMPANVRVSDLGGDFAQISWDAPATNVVEYAYEYTDGVTVKSGTTTNTYVDLASLDYETAYLFELKAVYRDGESCVTDIDFTTLEACPTPRNLKLDNLTSNSALISWTGSGPDSFTFETGTISTSKATQTILSEGFEGGSMPTGWSQTGSYWTITSGTGHSNYTGSATGSYNAGCYIGSYSGSDILITPAMDLGAASTATLSFNFWNTTWGGDINVLNVYYRVNGSDWTLLYTDDQANSGWTPVSIPLVNMAANYEIGFECQSNYSYGMGIDDVVVEAEVGSITWATVSTNASNPFDFSPLTPETTYRVRVYGVCGGTPGQPSDVLTFTTPACAQMPTNLQENNITINSADLSWDGVSDSYKLEYRPWLPAGEDVQPDGNVLKPIVYDLSGFTGNGSVVIRHYNCYNQFALIVDNIVVTDARGDVVFSEDFESCGGTMPSTFTNMDIDGDGHVWEIAASPQMRVDGSYGLASYSYDNDNGEILYPNNWLVINNIPMGGQITFDYCAQDADWCGETFCVYVSTENSIVERTPATTSYQATGLLPNTPYAWQVKGVCGTDESGFASSIFQTLNDEFAFVTAGYWSDAANWIDYYGNSVTAVPTANDKVRIEADAVIRDGEIAYAKTTSVVTGGSITIQQGGQLKQGTPNVDVTVEKTINGYDGGAGKWYFIATPVGTTLFASTATGWGYAQNLYNSAGTYDLYSFDPTQADEWYNYKAHTADFTKLFAKEGYLYANNETVTLNFIGTTPLKSLDKVETVDLTYTDNGNEYDGVALIGNPFTCNAYINFVDGSGNELAADFYMMNAEGTKLGVASSNVALPVCAGAMVDYRDLTGTIQFSTEAPAGGKGSALTMNVTNGRGNVDMARVRFGNGINLRKVTLDENSSKLYMTQDNNDYAVFHADNQGEMPVSFKAESNGTYTISFSTENVEFGYLHLIDNKTGNDVDLLKNSSYTFNASTTDYASRFRLVFNATGINEYSDEFAFISNGQIILNGQGTVEIYDVNGRMISRNTEVTTIATDNMSAGVYMLRLINGSDIKTQKIVVK